MIARFVFAFIGRPDRVCPLLLPYPSMSRVRDYPLFPWPLILFVYLKRLTFAPSSPSSLPVPASPLFSSDLSIFCKLAALVRHRVSLFGKEFAWWCHFFYPVFLLFFFYLFSTLSFPPTSLSFLSNASFSSAQLLLGFYVFCSFVILEVVFLWLWRHLLKQCKQNKSGLIWREVCPNVIVGKDLNRKIKM